MISIQPELWVDRGAEAIAFYQEAFDARVLHVVGSGEDIVAQLAVGDAAFCIPATESGGDRLVPRPVGGRTRRPLLVVADPTPYSLEPWPPVRALSPRLAKNTAGEWAGSSIPSVTNGRSVSRSCRGRLRARLFVRRGLVSVRDTWIETASQQTDPGSLPRGSSSCGGSESTSRLRRRHTPVRRTARPVLRSA
jgi:hypothetical protein